RGYEDLSDRLDLLAGLYHDNGDLDRAINALQESKQLCEQQCLEFDGGDMLDEYLVESEARSIDAGAVPQRGGRRKNGRNGRPRSKA
ncbi:MAG TPA: hypothetical protein VF306_16395, partial [Pirellulales bacterium]